MISRLLLTFETTRHLKLSQILARLRLMVLRRIDRTPSRDCFQPPPTVLPILSPFGTHPKRSYLGKNHYCFLNQTFETDGSWAPENTTRLWRFYLHYFDYLREIPTLHERLELISNWIAHVGPGTPDAWHPYPISLRICNWVWTVSLEWEDITSSFKHLFLQSLLQQLYYLNHHLEFDVVGNHLLENCKGLIIGGLFVQQDMYWKKGLRILMNELSEQILPDGGHYERSPMYHRVVLEDLMVIASALKIAGLFPEYERLIPFIHQATRFIETIAFQNELPMLNDSAHNVAMPPDYLIHVAVTRFNFVSAEHVPASYFFPDFGLYGNRTDQDYFCMDIGSLGPDFLLGHAHNDMLSILLNLENEAIFTDSGIFDYESGRPLQWRPVFRSTRAHNTLMISGKEQNEVWGSFRVARRGYPMSVQELANGIEAWHTGYKRDDVAVGRRAIVDTQNGIYTITDLIHSDHAVGFEGYLHAAPGIQLIPQPNGSIMIKTPTHSHSLWFDDYPVSTRVETSWYSPDFNLKELRQVLVYQGTSLPGETSITFTIKKQGGARVFFKDLSVKVNDDEET